MKLGLFSIGLDVYWPQFEGLEQRLIQYNASIEKRLAQTGLHVVNLGLIDTPQAALVALNRFGLGARGGAAHQ